MNLWININCFSTAEEVVAAVEVTAVEEAAAGKDDKVPKVSERFGFGGYPGQYGFFPQPQFGQQQSSSSSNAQSSSSNQSNYIHSSLIRR